MVISGVKRVNLLMPRKQNNHSAHAPLAHGLRAVMLRQCIIELLSDKMPLYHTDQLGNVRHNLRHNVRQAHNMW